MVYIPSARYSSVCNVLRQWRIWLIPTYRVVDSMIKFTRGFCISVKKIILLFPHKYRNIILFGSYHMGNFSGRV